MKIGELRQWGRERLSAAEIESASLDADLLLAAALACRREDLIIHPELETEPEQEEMYRSFIGRRQAREPIAYLLGVKEFFGHEFFVSQAVIIPRPETEILVEEALRLLALLETKEEIVLLDVGSGSGAIILSILLELKTRKKFAAVRALAIDRSAEALNMTRTNAARFGLETNVEFIQSDLLSEVSTAFLHSGNYALIAANLPYVPEQESLAPDVESYEPRIALRAGETGIEIIAKLMRQVSTIRPCTRGSLLLELGSGQRKLLDKELSKLPLVESAFIPDLRGIDRVLRVNYR